MNASILLLVVCFAALALLLLALCLYTRWPVWLKTAAILLVSGFFYLNYDALTGLLGFPTPAQLPSRFLYHYAVIVQPNKSTGEKGAIFLWATALGRDGPAREPRAYQLPFDKETYNMLTESAKRAKEGIVQMGTVSDDAPREGLNMFTRYLSAGTAQKVKMQDMPEPSLPEK